ncbi:hypothetical protein K9F62_03185 [Desulfovibrio sp. JY]|nr:hypothetical protein K9F62_03185 [Desulfovibrio sp. JY]
MGLFSKFSRKKDETINLDIIPEVEIEDVATIEMPHGSFRRKTIAEERVRVTLTMKKSTFESLRRFCNEVDANASQALRSGFRFAEQPFRKNPRLVKDFDE